MPGGKRKIITRRSAVFLTLVLLALDQVTKMWAFSALGPDKSFSFFGGTLRIRLVLNTGIAFGLFQGMPAFFIVFSALACIFLFWLIFLKDTELTGPELFAFSAILSGAAGNLIDRVRIGAVIDFIDLGFWPVFNVADSAITLGGLVLAYGFISSALCGEREV